MTGSSTEELTVDGTTRTFALRLPRERTDDPIPLVLVLHGNMESYRPERGGTSMSEGTTFDDRVDEWGVAVAYPDGVGGSWADGRGVTGADAAGVDDVAFLRALIEWAAAHHGTVADRAVCVGISNGAFMTHRMALEAGDLIAAIVAVAGALPESLCAITPRHAVSALLINGSADPLVPIEGGHSRHRGPDGELRGRMLSQDETSAFWRNVDRCDGDETIDTTTASGGPGMFDLTRRTVAGGVAGATVATWTLRGSGHAWPGSTYELPPEAEAAMGPTARNIDAATEAFRFALPLLAGAEERRL